MHCKALRVQLNFNTTEGERMIVLFSPLPMDETKWMLGNVEEVFTKAILLVKLFAAWIVMVCENLISTCHSLPSTYMYSGSEP